MASGPDPAALSAQEAHEQVRTRTLTCGLPACLLLGTAVFILANAMRGSHAIEWLGFGLAVLPLAVAVAMRRSHSVAGWLFCSGLLGAALCAQTLGLPGQLLPLFAPVVGLTVLLLGSRWAFAWSAAVTLALAVGSPPLFSGTSLERALSIGLVWAAWAMLSLVLAIAREDIVASWKEYSNMRAQLEEARNQRLELKHAQANLEQANDELARLTDRLAAMRRAAEEARRVKEEFVANVSHELRTPLNMVIGFTEAILRNPQVYKIDLSPTLLADLEVVYRNSEHLSSLIDDVLDLSQIEAGRWALTKENVVLEEIVDAAADVTRPLFESKGLHLHKVVEEALPETYCDRTRIREVLVNLLSNAGRFTDAGGVDIHVRRQGPDIVVSVSDTGPGIPEEALQRLFQPFEQVDNSIRRRYSGSGLGLAISRGFVELHSGKMWAESTVGKGTTFSFSLPIEEPLKGTGFERWFGPYVASPEGERGAIGQLPTPRPLLVVLEPADQLQRLLLRYFQQVDIIHCPDLESALEALAEHPAHALLINDGEGRGWWESLRQQGELPFATPVIQCSFPAYHALIRDLGVVDYLVKPIAAEQLLNALNGLGLKGRTVLVVDDEADARRLFYRILALAQPPYRVLRAASGEEAIAILESERVDAILLDLVMPAMDGFRFLGWRSSTPIARDIPVLVVSAHDLAQPMVARELSLMQGTGLSADQVLSAIEAFIKIANPEKLERRQGPPRVPRD